LEAAGRRPEAVAPAREAVEAFLRLTADGPPHLVHDAVFQVGIVSGYLPAGDAVQPVQAAVDVAAKLVAEHPEVIDYRERYAWALQVLASRQRAAGLAAEASATEASSQQAQSQATAIKTTSRLLHSIGYGAALGEALKAYARAWHVHLVDGFDNQFEVVRSHLSGRRCAFPDRLDANGELVPLAFGSSHAETWSRGFLTYGGSMNGSGLDDAAAWRVIDDAFRDWANASLGFFQFTRTHLTGDFTILFGGSEHKEQLGSPGGAAAYALSPEEGDIVFDSAETWVTGRPGPGQVSLRWIALHEIGHALGLQHSSNAASVMYPAPSADAIDLESAEQIALLYGWTPQAPVLGPTNDRPTAAVAGPPTFIGSPEATRMLAAWRGDGDNRNLYWSTYEDGIWSAPRQIAGSASTHNPAAAHLHVANGETMYFMAWKGAADDHRIWYSTRLYTDPDWAAQRLVQGTGGAPDPGTSRGPTVTPFGDRIWMAWRGIGDDQRIWYSTFDDGYWEPQRHINGVGTSDGPFLVGLGDRLYLFWKGVDGDSWIYYTWRDAGSAGWAPQARVDVPMGEPHGPPVMRPIASTHGPTAAPYGNRLVLAWKGVEGDHGIYLSLFDGEWTGQQRIANRGSTQAPALVAWNDHLHMIWRGITGDARIYFSTWGRRL